MSFRTYRIIIEDDANATYHGYVPALPGCHTWGTSIEEVKTKLKEATELYIEDMVADDEEVPVEKSLESFETVAVPDINGLAYA